ncbi:MAG: hypothetical protein A2W08_06005 [Candidatus Rokubacteria bacterium RBG_16_73_20]|nr:MAG: hypothetical protein A2050_08945 [Candidatus Rokubacteria bacterium GWA2_73_35]OGK96080.1 MAG: hypothetical protein A2W08_06005 [Candidatus Rokubacteria bacterium RBG_16_73_20]HBH01947.1 hypothetical protein [Candidatus Rokubacteria bacterium]
MAAMKIELRWTDGGGALRARVSERLTELLEALEFRPTSVHATFTDENGPKGGSAFRCALEVRLPRREPVHVEDVSPTPRLAFDGALAKLERQLARVRETSRVLKRRPKKYFVAKRALSP